MKREKIELMILAALITVGLGVAFYNYIYSVDIKEIKVLKDEIQESDNRLEKLKNNQDGGEAYILKLQDINSEIKQIEKKVPFTKDVPELLVELYKMIVENGLTGDSVSFSSLNEGENYNYYNISFDVEGDKKDINELMKQIENFNRKISLSSIDFNMEDKSTLKAKIVLKVYVQKDTVVHKEPSDYDFMEGKYGTFKSVYEMFSSLNKVEGAVQNVDSSANEGTTVNAADNSEDSITTGDHLNTSGSTQQETSPVTPAVKTQNSSTKVVNAQDQDGGANP